MDAITNILKSEMEDFCVLNNKLLGFPKPPTSQVGGGKHLNIDYENAGPGWTLRYCELFQHPSNGLWAHEVDQTMTDASIDPQYTGNLTSQEVTDYQTLIATKVTLDSTWFPEA